MEQVKSFYIRYLADIISGIRGMIFFIKLRFNNKYVSMMTRLFSLLFICLMASPVFAQPFASWADNSLVLDNGSIRRVIQLDTDQKGLVCKSLKIAGDSQEFIIPGSEEFSFVLDGVTLSGLDSWKMVEIIKAADNHHGDGVKVVMEHPEIKVQIGITYLMYPKLPLVRKKISFLNMSGKEMNLESLDIEWLRFDKSGSGTDCWVMHDYARQKSLGQYISNWYDPVIVVHEVTRRRGIAIGNEAPGVMKRTTTFLKNNLLTAGLTHIDQNFGFRKWIKPGETWESSWIFSVPYSQTDDPWKVLNGTVNDFVRRHMGTRLSAIPQKPVFVYNTWEPFFHNINEKLILELADAAAECGIEEFIIDDGWQASYGDWGINSEKFPDGLKPVFDYIKQKGMKPGIWISVAAAESVSNVHNEHQEWLIRKKEGTPVNIHSDSDKMYQWESHSMCMTTGWRDYIKNVILNLVEEHGLEYVKADFATVTGAYTTDKSRSGCYATNHSAHKDRNESLLEMYQATWKLFDELHSEAPNLFIDCTFETMGALQLIDFDMCKHAEGNWLSNFSEKAPGGSLRVRQMAWWRSPAIPATAMVIGNQHLDDPEFELSLKSLMGSLPIVLGDPRQLSKEQRSRMKQWADWLRTMQTKHDFMMFRQDLQGFNEPIEGSWDGYQRINSDTRSGGIIGVFKHGSTEEVRNVTIQHLDPVSKYSIVMAPEGKTVIEMSGYDLENKGFEVKLTKKYDGSVFEILKTSIGNNK